MNDTHCMRSERSMSRAVRGESGSVAGPCSLSWKALTTLKILSGRDLFSVLPRCVFRDHPVVRLLGFVGVGNTGGWGLSGRERRTVRLLVFIYVKRKFSATCPGDIIRAHGPRAKFRVHPPLFGRFRTLALLWPLHLSSLMNLTSKLD